MYLILALLLTFINLTQAQTANVLHGRVTDENGQGVGFANVAVLAAASQQVVTGAIADAEGMFRIKTPAAGKYTLKISNVGFVTMLTPVFDVNAADANVDFRILQLKADAKTLREVQVQTLRPAITTTPDKMVVSIENTALAEGSTAYDILTKSPGVWVDQNGNIQLNGKGGVQVMLNGRRSYLSEKELVSLLQGMAAENLKDLEIITNPSARFDAEGASGIININLKKSKASGINGSVYGGYQFNKLSSYTSGAELSHKKGPWNSSASINLNRRMRYRDMTMDRIFLTQNGSITRFEQTGYEQNERQDPSLRLSTDYELNAQHSLGAMATLTANKNIMVFNTASYLRNDTDLFIDARNKDNSKYTNGTFNIHYVGKLDTSGTTLSVDADYVHISSNDIASFLNLYQTVATGKTDSTEHLRNENPTSFDIYSIKADFTRQLNKKTTLEVGAKASHVKSDNELRFYEVRDEQQVPDARRSNHFLYTENIFAAYASLSATLSETWSVQAGLRAEQTLSDGNSLTKNEKTNRRYTDFFPTLFVQQKLSDKYQIGYKYSRRISRPYYENLNPFIFYLDPYTYAYGNPQLKPQYITSFEVTQSFKQTYNLVLGYALTKDFITEVPEQHPETNTTVFQQQNVKDLRSATATLAVPVRISGNWEISNNLTGMYQEYTNSINNNVVVNDKFTVIASTNHTVSLPHGFRAEASANYQSPLAYGLYQVGGQWWVDAGLKRSFLNDKLSVSLNATDLFRSRLLDVKTELNGNVNAIHQYQGQQSIRLNLRYSFNRGASFEAKKRTNNLDELNRTGNN